IDSFTTHIASLSLHDALPICYLNRRYLVVPVKPAQGVFHSKLSLLVSADSAHVFCGSNNLTQAGCTHNLELLNYLSTDCKSDKRSEEHTSELQSRFDLVCRLL